MIKDEETGADGWGFECPIHGLELQLHCFRAFQEENKDRWFMINLTIIEPSDEQRTALMKLLQEKMQV